MLHRGLGTRAKLRNILRIHEVGMPTIETNTRQIVAKLRAEGWIQEAACPIT